MLDLIGPVLAFSLTLAVLSYLIGDNPLYRLAIHIFVGATAGYAAIVAWSNVIYPLMVVPIFSTETLGNLLAFNTLALTQLISPAGGLLLGLLLLLKSRSIALGSVATAFMVGVGAAIAIGGAVTGTLFPQINATSLSLLPFDAGGFNGVTLIENLIIIVGTLTTLMYFYYSARRNADGLSGRMAGLLRPLKFVGEVFIGLTFGVLYAGAMVASLALFSERMLALIDIASLLMTRLMGPS